MGIPSDGRTVPSIDPPDSDHLVTASGAEHGNAVDALVFDLDGVLVDSERVVHEVWSETFAAYGASFSMNEWLKGVGTDHGFDPLAALGERSTVPLPPSEELLAEIRAKEKALAGSLGPMPGVTDWIAAAQGLGLGLAVASSSPRSWIMARLEGAGIAGSFPVAVSPDHGRAAKPAPDVYLAACESLGVAPRRALAVEDSVNGLTAALAAGMWCVVVPNVITDSLDFTAASLQIPSLADVSLEEVLDRLGGGSEPHRAAGEAPILSGGGAD